MHLRYAISAPLPWLTLLAVRLFGKKIQMDKKHASLRLPLLPRTLRFTKEGKRFTAILFLIGIAAINTGNNLLYLVVAMMLSLIIISGIMSESTLRGLTARRRLPEIILKGASTPVRIEIENAKKHLPSYSFEVEEMPVENVEAKPTYTLKLDAKKKTLKGSPYVFKKRGEQTLQGIRFKTRFPFGLFVKGRVEGKMEKAVVYPSIRPVKPHEVLSFTYSGESVSRKKGEGFEFYGLRDYMLMDDSRYIHWKASARMRKLLTKEFEKEAERKVLIVFDNFSDTPSSFEETVDTVASVSNHFIERGYPVALKTLKANLSYGSGASQLKRILRFLAFIEPVEGEKGNKASLRILGL